MSKRVNKKMKTLPKNKESKSCVDVYKEETKSKSEILVLDKFPERILEIQELLEDEKFGFKNLSLYESDVNIAIPPKPSKDEELSLQSYSGSEGQYSNIFMFENGLVDTNPHLMCLIETVKPKALQLISDANTVKMGVSLMIPKIEDGNNFGVSIQREILIGVAVAELKTRQHLDQFPEFFKNRAETVTKIAIYPHCMDYRRALLEMDYKFRLFLCLFVVDLRNEYISLHDMFTKNINKIKEPRNSDNHQLMY